MPMDTLVFDVNETLLDLAALDPLFERHLGSATQRKAWFADMLVSAMTLNRQLFGVSGISGWDRPDRNRVINGMLWLEMGLTDRFGVTGTIAQIGHEPCVGADL